MMPFLPRATNTTSGEFGSIVTSTSHCPAASGGELAALAPDDELVERWPTPAVQWITR
jgi:hypothetical protein